MGNRIDYAKASPEDKRIRIDLSGVTFVDDKGRHLLERFFQEGAELNSTRVMTKGIIDEIKARRDSAGDTE